MRLMLIRHGVTAYNTSNRYTGQGDIPLTSEGILQSESVAKKLCKFEIDALYSSDLQRCQTMAEAIIERNPHIPEIEVTSRLREICFGEWEGLTHDEISRRDPELLKRWDTDPVHFSAPGGENVGQFGERIADIFSFCLDKYSENETVVWCTHGGLIGVLLCHLLGMPLDKRWMFKRDNGSISELEVTHEYAIIEYLNDTSHLK